MKNIKNVLMTMLVAVFFFAACQQENVVPDAVNNADVTGQDVIPGDTTDSEYDDDGEYEGDDDDDD